MGSVSIVAAILFVFLFYSPSLLALSSWSTWKSPLWSTCLGICFWWKAPPALEVVGRWSGFVVFVVFSSFHPYQGGHVGCLLLRCFGLVLRPGLKHFIFIKLINEEGIDRLASIDSNIFRGIQTRRYPNGGTNNSIEPNPSLMFFVVTALFFVMSLNASISVLYVSPSGHMTWHMMTWQCDVVMTEWWQRWHGCVNPPPPVPL